MNFREAWEIAQRVVEELSSDEYRSWDLMAIRDNIIEQLLSA